MTKSPLVSIVIPVFNGANFVGDAIESALAQTYSNVEVIVVDDGSDDGGATSGVVGKFEPYVRYIRKSNGGVATALNTGISAMRGELFSWLSHDDLYKPDKVARQVQTFHRSGQRCVVIGDFELMNERGEFIDRISLAGRNLVGRPLEAVFHSLINGCALLVPRYLFREAGTFESGLPTTQDYHLWYRIARLTPFVHCPHADVRQRVHPLQGSRHAAHLDEASRMFIHLIDSTPLEVMRAYDGSPLRFLMKVRECLNGYPGLRAYLDFRIDELLQQFRYSVVFCPGAGKPAAAQQADLRKMKHPPAEILYSGPKDGAVRVPIPKQVEAALRETSADTVVFLPADELPAEAEILSALCRFIHTGSDIALPKRRPGSGPALGHVITRRSALPMIAEAWSDETSGWQALPPHIHLTEYSVSGLHGQARRSPKALRRPTREAWREAPALALKLLGRNFREAKRGTSSLARSLGMVVPAKRIEAALQGQSRLAFSWGASERAVIQALTAMQKPTLPTILFLSHRLGGGAHRHLAELVRALNGRANCIAGFGGSGGTLHLCAGPTREPGGVVFHIPTQLDAVVRILRRTGVRRVDVHNTVGFEDEAQMLLDSLGLPYDVTLTDYHLVAINPHLCFGDGRFVGDNRLEDPESGMLRNAPMPVLSKADRVITLCRDMCARMHRLHPDLPLVAGRHWHDSSAARVRHVFIPRLWANEPLRIVVVGHIAESKGRWLILDAARIASKRRLPIRFHILGEMDLPARGQEDWVDTLTIHGRFDSEKFSERLGAITPHLAWLPAQVPETWSYVLTDLLESALPLAASSIGAIPERCYGRPATWLLPWESDAETWVEMFLKLHATQLREPPLWTSLEHLPPAETIYFDEYLHPAKHGREQLANV